MAVDLHALVQRAAVAALNAQAEAAQRATQDLAPRDTGELVESIKTTDATPGSLVSQVYSDVLHAVFQHEDLTAQHTTGQAKFMEAAVTENRAAIAAAGASAAAKILG